MCFTLLIEMTASLCVGRDDPARQTTPEAHPHPALRATFPLEGGRSREEGEPQNLPPLGGEGGGVAAG